MITFILCAHSLLFVFVYMKFALNTLKKRFEMLVVSNNLLPLPLN